CSRVSSMSCTTLTFGHTNGQNRFFPPFHKFQSVSFEWFKSRGQPDPHEKSRESLREVFQVGRLQAPAPTDAPGMCGEVTNWKADDLPEIDHLCLEVILWMVR